MNFDLARNPLHKGVNCLEASAGTGKTFALAGLYLRLLLEEKIPARDILVVTFTEAATAELRDRIRKRLTEALRVLEGESSEDPLLLRVKEQVKERLSTAVSSLRNALEIFDLVSIHTIHGFCQRTLQDSAFESGMLFDVELVTDQEKLIREVAADYCRKQLHCADPVITSAAMQAQLNPDVLSRLLRQYLTYPELRIVTAAPVRPIEQIAEDLEGAFEECATCLKKAARKKGEDNRKPLVAYFVGGSKWAVKEHAKEEILEAYAIELARCTDSAELTPGFWQAAQFFSTSAVQVDVGKGKTMPPGCPDVCEPCERLIVLSAEYGTAHRANFFDSARELLARRKQEAKQQSYDDLITRLARALEGPAGAALAASIRNRYRAALIDESQDTDPLQWNIFKRVFAESPAHWLYLIGDPKQAIYGFRGADVNTYLQAAATAKHTFSLGTNWRSESALVQAVNALFSSAGPGAFVEQKIGFESVQPGPKADREPLLFPPGNTRPASFQVWCWEPEGQPVNAGDARYALPRAVAAEISRLLRDQVRIGESRIIQPRDFAVLVESHRQARWIQDALHELRIPSVEQAMESVFDSDEARQVQWILSAVLTPGRESVVKAALITAALGCNGTGLQELVANESAWQRRLQAFARYREIWDSDGFFAMFGQLVRQERVVENLLRFPDAERRITNLLHIAELLESACKSEHLGPARLVRWLEERRTAEGAASDDYQLRLESDEDAVQIITIHRSKGLQYPVVFCPFVSKDSRLRQVKVNNQSVLDLVLYHDAADGKLSWEIDDSATHSSQATREQLAERVRLLYVALTRACNRCYLVSARYAKSKTTALAWLMRERNELPEDPVEALEIESRNSGPWKPRWEQIADAAAQRILGQPAIAVDDLPLQQGKKWIAPQEASAELRSRVCKREHIERSWLLSSFTNLAAQLTPFADGAEESGLPDHDELTSASASVSAPVESASGIFALPSGASTGNCLHKILESFDFSEPVGDETSVLVSRQLAAAGLDPAAHGPAVLQMLERVRSAQLDSAEPSLVLSSVPAQQRLAEMEFYFPAGRLEARKIMDLIRHGKRRKTAPAPDRIHAFMKGFIDLVLVHNGRYHILDWKSNFLGSDVGSYTPEAMKAEVEDSFYDLQYHIYTVALDRFLRQRLPDYHYDRHFGGVHYVFLRGLDPDRPELGIFTTRPEAQLVERLSSVLGIPEVRQ